MKLKFGYGVWIDNASFVLGLIKSQLFRELNRLEVDELYVFFNSYFSQNVERDFESWKKSNPTRPFFKVLPINEQLSFWGSNIPVRTVILEISENLEQRSYLVNGRKVIPDYIASFKAPKIQLGYNIWVESAVLLGAVKARIDRELDVLEIAELLFHVNVLFDESYLSTLNTWLTSNSRSVFVAEIPIDNRLSFIQQKTPPITVTIEIRKNLDQASVQVKDKAYIPDYIASFNTLPIYKTISRSALENALPDLIQLAENENWRIDALRYYVESVFSQLKEDEQYYSSANESGWLTFSHPRMNLDATIFNTGLVAKKDGWRYIYAYCSNREFGVYQSIDWKINFSDNAGRTRSNPELLSVTSSNRHHGLPIPPNWIRQSHRLLFDYRYGSIREGAIAFFYEHIYQRLVEGRLNSLHVDEFRARFPTFSYAPFKQFLDDAWRHTRKLLQKSFKIAIPTYYKGKIQLLAPLYLSSNQNEVSVALVVSLNEDRENKPRCHYFCPTVLSLEMARNDSRVITRIEGTWLYPKNSPQTDANPKNVETSEVDELAVAFDNLYGTGRAKDGEHC